MLIDIFETESGLIILGEFPDNSIVQAIDDSAANAFSLVILRCEDTSDKLDGYLNVIEKFCLPGTIVYVFNKYSERKKRPIHKLIIRAEENTSWTFSSLLSGNKFGEVACFYLDNEENVTNNKDKSINKFTGKKRMFGSTKRWVNPAELFDSVYEKYGIDRLIEIIIKCHTKKGDWVFDPMSKKGTIALVAAKMGRRFVCVENDCEDFVFAIESIKNA